MKYKILRSHRLRDEIETTIEASGLEIDAARQERDRLNEVERQAKPTQTSWTRDVFIIEREKESGK